MNSNNKLILIVDDSPFYIDILVETLEDEYTIKVATDGEAALSIIENKTPDLILLDIMMPKIDGFEVCRKLKQKEKTKNIPVIFLTSLTDSTDEGKGLKLGAVDYIIKPFNSDLVKARIKNHLELKEYRDDLENLVQKRTIKLAQTRDAVIEIMAILSEYRDNNTGQHINRTKNYIKVLATELSLENPNELSNENIDLLCQAALLHDIGKIGIKDSILLKKGSLTENEFEEMKRHTIIGGEMIKKTEELLGETTFLNMARKTAQFHHERWDGSGYPYGLKKDEIPLCAQIMSIIDIYDAIISERPYKKAQTHEQAIKAILLGDERIKPEFFSPKVLSAFSKVQNKFKNVG